MKNKRKIFFNARIFTGSSSYDDTMIIENGKIIYVGKYEDADKSSGKMINAQGKCILPGFIDCHMHPVLLAETLSEIPCVPPDSYSIEDIQKRIKEASLNSHDSWIRGYGFDENKMKEKRMLNRYDLDQACSDKPVLIMRTCYHIMIVNSRALEIAGINKDTKDPEGGIIDRDEEGNPTGVLRENAKDLISNVISRNNTNYNRSLLQLSKTLSSKGITSVCDCLALDKDEDYLSLYNEASENGFKQNVTLYYDFREVSDKNIKDRKCSSNIKIGGIKLIADGSISGRTAYLNTPYEESDSYGTMTVSRKEILDGIKYAKNNKMQLVIHTMGDKTTDCILECIDEDDAWCGCSVDKPSLRLEHMTFLRDEAMDEIKKKNIALTSQPIFMYAEIESYIKNLGLNRLNDIYRYRTMLDKGIKLAFSSDSPATSWSDSCNPFVGIESAVTRTAYDGTIINKEESVSVIESLKMYTENSAYVSGYNNKGKLKNGYDADFIIIDKDILSIPPDDIHNIKVEETYINGERVYVNR